MTTYTMSKCKVTFARCSGNSVISSYTVCTTLLNSEDVPTMRSISISQIVVLPDITDVIVLSISQFFSLPTSVPTLHRGFTHDSHVFWNQAHDCTIVPKVAAVAWCFFLKSCVECILRENLLFLFCFSYIA